MSEAFEIEPPSARILEMQDLGEGIINFVIDEAATSRDVLATLRYLEPDDERINSTMRRLLSVAVEAQGILKNTHIFVKDPLGEISPQVHALRLLQFGDNPTMEDVVSGFDAIYGYERTPEKLEEMVLGLIDLGHFRNATIRADFKNEIMAADEDEIEVEMRILSDRHRDTSE